MRCLMLFLIAFLGAFCIVAAWSEENKYPVPATEEADQIAMLKGIGVKVLGRLRELEYLAKQAEDIVELDGIQADIRVMENIMRALNNGDLEGAKLYFPQCSPRILRLKDEVLCEPAKCDRNSPNPIYVFRRPDSWGKPIQIVPQAPKDPNPVPPEPQTTDVLYPSPATVFCDIVHHKDNVNEWYDDPLGPANDVGYRINIAGMIFWTGRTSVNNNDFDCDLMLSQSVYSNPSIIIEAWDVDGGWSFSNQIDISPTGSEINITYSLSNKTWSGEVSTPYAEQDANNACWFYIESGYDDEMGKGISWMRDETNHRSGAVFGGTSSSSAPVIQNNAGLKYQDAFTNPSSNRWMYYKFYVQSGDYFQIYLDDLEYDYDLYLYNPSGTQKDYSLNGGTTADHVEYTADVSGWWYIGVYAYDTTTTSGETGWFTLRFSDQLVNDYNYITLPSSGERGFGISSYNGVYNYNDNNDYYKFYVTSGSGRIRFVITPSSGTDFDLYLYNPSGSQMDYSYNTGSTPDTVEYDVDVTGFWYARVYRYSGWGYYTFSAELLNLNDSYEDDDYCYQWQWIAPTTSNQTQSRTIWPAGDYDYMRFTAVCGRKYIFYSTGSLDTYGYLGTDNCSVITENDDGGGGGNFRIEWCCTATGNYKLWVRAYSSSATGSYTLNYSYTVDPACNADSYESDDACASAKPITPGSIQNHTINRDGADIDWVTFTTTYPADFSVYTWSSDTLVDTRLWLYRGSCASLTEVGYDDDGGPGTLSWLTMTCQPPGTYYVKVDEYGNSDNICAYTINLTPLVDRSVSAPTLTAPSNGARTTGSSVTLSWSTVSGATGYRVIVNGTQIYDGTSTSISYSPTRCQNYSWYVVAYNACASQNSETRTFRHNGLPALSLSSPANNYHNTTGTVNLVWSASDCDGDAIQYQVYFGTSNPPPLYTTTTSTSITVSTSDRCEPYYWRIRAYDGYEYSDYTETRVFYENVPPPTPSLILPGDGGRTVGNNPTLTWASTTDCNGDAVQYQVYFGTSSTPPLYTTTSSNSISVPTTDCTQYYWQIRAYDGYEYSSYSGTRTFRENGAPSAPTLNSPADGATVTSTPTTIRWNNSTDCDGDPLTYTYVVDTENPPTPPYIATGTTTGTTSSPFPVEHMRTYYWRVRANDGFEDGNWSSVWSFNVRLPTVMITIQTNVSGGTITADGTPHSSPYTVEWVVGSVHEIGCPSPQMEAGDTRYIFSSWSDGGAQYHNITVPSTPTTYTATLTRQFRITITNNPAAAGGGQVRVDGTPEAVPYVAWFNEGSTHTIGAIDSAGTPDTRYIWSNWSDGGAKTHNITVTSSSPRTYTANFITQYYLTVNTGGHGRATGEGWYNAGANASFSIDPYADESGGERWRFTSWIGSGSGSYSGNANPATCTMNGPVTETATWTHQYSFVVSNPGGYDTPNPAPGTYWYDENTNVSASVSSPYNVSDGVRAICTGFTGTGSCPSDTGISVSFTINAPSTLRWNWKIQYRFIVQNPSGYDAPSPPVGEHWYDAGTTVTGSVSSPVDTFYCIGYDGTGSLPSGPGTSFSFNIGMPSSVRWNWAPAGAVRRLVIVCPYDEPNPPAGTFYFLNNTRIEARVTSPANHPTDPGIRYRCTGWTGTGSVPASGDSCHIEFVITQNSTLTWNWITQYRFDLSNPGNHDSPRPPAGTYWYDAGATVSGDINLRDGSFVCAGYDGSGSIGDGVDTTFSFAINSPSSVTWIWMNESELVYLDVISEHGTPSPVPGRHFFVPNTLVNATCPASVSGGEGIRYICTGWTGTGSVPASGSTNAVSFNITMNSSITWNWRTEFRLTISSAFDTPNPSNGDHWYSSGTSITAYVNLRDGDMVCTGYFGSGSVSNGYDTTVTFTITAPSSITWLWTEFSSTVSLVVSSERGNPVPARGTHYYAPGTSITAYLPDSIITVGETRYIVSGYTGTGSVGNGSGARVSFTIRENSTLNWLWKTQYQFTVSSTFGAPVPPVGSHWFDAGSTVNGSNALIDRGPTGEVVCIGYDGSGSLGDAPDTSFSFILNTPSSVTWLWIPIDSAALLTVNCPYDAPYPSHGRHYFRRNTTIEARLGSTMVGDERIRRVFTNWTGTGSVPSSGDSSHFTFTITQNSSLTWNWRTEYHILLDFAGCGTYTPSQSGAGWYASGTDIAIVSDSVVGVEGDMYAFRNWTSTPEGAMIRDASNHRTTLTVTGPYTITANYTNAIKCRLAKDPCHNFGYFIIDSDTVPTTTCTLLVYLAYNTNHLIGTGELDTNTVTGYGYRFRWWSDRGDRIHAVGPLRSDTIFVATYDPLYRAIIRKEPAQTLGSLTVDRILYTGPSSARIAFWWNAGSIHNIVASSPDISDTIRYTFVRWSDGGAIDHNITINAPTEYIAYYRTEFFCRIVKQPAESYGSISIGDSTYNRVSSKTFWAVKDSSYLIGVSRLDLSVDSIYIFDHWSDGGEIVHNTAPIRSPTLFVAYYNGMQGILRACISRGFWDVGSIELGMSRRMSESEMITIENCGTVPMTLGLSTFDPERTWSPGYTNGENIYILRARFDDNRTPPGLFDPRFDYVKSAITWATDRAFGPGGFNIEPPPSSDIADNMWLEFVAPLGSTSYGRKTIHLIIELSVYLP